MILTFPIKHCTINFNVLSGKSCPNSLMVKRLFRKELITVRFCFGALFVKYFLFKVRIKSDVMNDDNFIELVESGTKKGLHHDSDL